MKKKKKENENKFGEEKMLSKSKEKEGKGKELGVVMELNRRENTKEKVLFDLFYFIKKKKKIVISFPSLSFSVKSGERAVNVAGTLKQLLISISHFPLLKYSSLFSSSPSNL